MECLPFALVERETLRRYGVDGEALARARVDWRELRAIHTHYLVLREQLAPRAEAVAATLRPLDAAHAVRARIKEAEHLIAKVIRKQLHDPELQITVENYPRKITDLAGVRVLLRLTADWSLIHEYVLQHWQLAEPPVAYVAAVEDGEPYAARGCQIRVHLRGYQAVHYLLRSGSEEDAQLIELQVNTLFEEAWSEVDHAAAYPGCAPGAVCAQLLETLHHLARAGDHLATCIARSSSEVDGTEDEGWARVREVLGRV